MKQFYKISIKITIIFLFFASTISAQTFKSGAMLGFSGSQIDGDMQAGYNKLGAFAGVFVKTNFSKITGVKIELNYTGKGATKTTNKIQEFKTHLNYVELPILITFELLKDIEINVGVSPAYLISSKLYEIGYEIPETEYDLQNYDFSGIVSICYNFVDNFSLNARVNYSIVPIMENPGWFNSNICFALVYKFN